tara:strand:- start:1027 stop:1332 length:306 start_codon:yes stop_codon:yes gene_type:complete
MNAWRASNYAWKLFQAFIANENAFRDVKHYSVDVMLDLAFMHTARRTGAFWSSTIVGYLNVDRILAHQLFKLNADIAGNRNWCLCTTMQANQVANKVLTPV